MNEVNKRHAYSGVIGIEISSVRSDNNKMLNELCIVFLCLDEYILDNGELPFLASREPRCIETGSDLYTKE